MKTLKILLALVAVGSGFNSAFGQTWTQTTAPTNEWSGIASSADGTKLVAACFQYQPISTQEGVYVSTNSGLSWVQTSARSGGAVASSADGTKLVAVAGFISTSFDSGVSWNLNYTPNRSGFDSIASSADGRVIVGSYYDPAFANKGNVWLSTNTGTS